jgi:hypothetical protein
VSLVVKATGTGPAEVKPFGYVAPTPASAG